MGICARHYDTAGDELANIKNTIILFFCPSKLLHLSVVTSFSWDHCKSQEKPKTMLMENVGRTNKKYYGIFDIG